MIANFMTNRKQWIVAQTPQLNHIANKEKHKIWSSTLYNPDLSQHVNSSPPVEPQKQNPFDKGNQGNLILN